MGLINIEVAAVKHANALRDTNGAKFRIPACQPVELTSKEAVVVKHVHVLKDISWLMENVSLMSHLLEQAAQSNKNTARPVKVALTFVLKICKELLAMKNVSAK